MAITRYIAFVLFLIATTFMAGIFDARMQGDAAAGAEVEQAIRITMEKVRLLAVEVGRNM